jgi:hypothetical protein
VGGHYVKQVFVALLLTQVAAGCVATNQQLSTASVDRAMSQPRRTVSAEPAPNQSEQDELRQRIVYLETQLEQINRVGAKSSTRTVSIDRVAALEAQLAALQRSQESTLTTGSIEGAGERLQALEARLAAVEQASRAAADRTSRTVVESPNRTAGGKSDETIVKRMAAIEAQLAKIEKSSELAVQMGLITTVHSDRNEEGIGSIRGELDKIATDIAALRSRLTESDQQLEVGLLQLRELSARLK